MSRKTSKRQRLIGLCLLALGLWSASVKAQQPNWAFDSGNYEQNMMMTGIVYLNELEVRDTSGTLGAFLKEECRGINKPVFFQAMNKYIVSMVVFGHNADENKYITFKYFDVKDSTTHVLIDSVLFQSDAILGNFANLHKWGARPSSIPSTKTTSLFTILYSNSGQASLHLKTPLSESVILQIISVNGSTLFKQTFNPGTSSISLANLSSGFYFITLEGMTIREKAKLVIR